MELVVLFPRSTESIQDKLFLQVDENGKYSQIEITSTESKMALLTLDNLPSNVFLGVILRESTFQNMTRLFTFDLMESLKSDNLAIQLNSTDFIWFEQISDINVRKLIDFKEAKQEQLIVFEANTPFAISPEFDFEETDPERKLIRVFISDSNGKISFLAKFHSLDFYRGSINEIQTKSKRKFNFTVVSHQENSNTTYSLNGSVEVLKNGKRAHATVLMKEVSSNSQATAASVKTDDLINTDAYKAAFSTKLVGRIESDKLRLVTAIRDVNTNMSIHWLYTPTISICQSSGSGKSKLACSLDDEFPCAYVVFRDKDELAYPGKSKLGDLFINCTLNCAIDSFDCVTLSQTNIGTYAHLLWAIASDYLARVIELKKQHFASEQVLSIESSKFIRKTIIDEFIEGKLFGTELDKFKRHEPLELLASKDMDALMLDFKSITKKISTELCVAHETCPFIIILDEANFLLDRADSENLKVDRLRLLRRATHYLGVYSNVVFLTLGTKSDYMDLNPSIGFDSMRDDKRKYLYPPFVLSRNTDLFNKEIAKLHISCTMLKDPRFALVRISMGRPVWSALDLSKVAHIARVKLLNSSLDTGEALVACWMLRTGIPASPHMVDTSRHLVKSNMGTLLNIHPTLPIMNVSYPSEPVLGAVAQNIVSENLVKYFAKLRTHLLCSGFDRGDLAETLAAEICLEAIHKAKTIDQDKPREACSELNGLSFIDSKKFVLQSKMDPAILESKIKEYKLRDSTIENVAGELVKQTTLRDFLKSLYGNSLYESFELETTIDSKMLNGIVDFNHFIRLNHGLPMKDFFTAATVKNIQKNRLNAPNLKNRSKKYNCRAFNSLGLKRSAAFLMPQDHPGSDICIPICVEDDPNRTSGKPTLAILSIQVKAGSLVSYVEELEVAEKLFLDKRLIKCTANLVCKGCDDCESDENMNYMLQNQLALVLTFGEQKKQADWVNKIEIDGSCNKLPKSSKLTVIFNDGLGFLKDLWGPEYQEISAIVRDIIQFSWLPHNFIDKNSGTGSYHHNQLLDTYLDKPMFPEFSDIFRNELGWGEIVNPTEADHEKYRNMIKKMNLR